MNNKTNEIKPRSIREIVKAIIGWLSVLAGVFMLVFYLLTIVSARPYSRLEVAFTWYLPIILAAIIILICGIFSLKEKSWKLAVAGLYIFGLVAVYSVIIIYIFSWQM